MLLKPTIQRVIAFFLVLVFFISTAPKAYFHDLVADHRDFSDCQQLHHSTVLHQQGLNCHFDDVVVTSPFVSSIEQPLFSPGFYFEKEQSTYSFLYLSSFIEFKESRGPPIV